MKHKHNVACLYFSLIISEPKPKFPTYMVIILILVIYQQEQEGLLPAIQKVVCIDGRVRTMEPLLKTIAFQKSIVSLRAVLRIRIRIFWASWIRIR